MRLPTRLAASAATIAPAAAAVSAAAAKPAFRLGTSFVDCQRATAHLVLVELGGGLLRLFVGGHLDESEPAGTAGCGIPHDANRFHVAGFAEQLLQFSLASGVWQISDVQPSTHYLSPRPAAGRGYTTLRTDHELTAVAARRLCRSVEGGTSRNSRLDRLSARAKQAVLTTKGA